MLTYSASISQTQFWLEAYSSGPSEIVPDDDPVDGVQSQPPVHVTLALVSEGHGSHPDTES